MLIEFSPNILTVPGLHILLLSLRSTSVHMVSSLSSFLFESSFFTCSASSRGSPPLSMVPEMGHVSTRIPANDVVG